MSSLHIAMLGTRGLPATFGGVERHVEEIGRRLVAAGHRVTVYSQRGYGADVPSTYLGMEVVPIPVVHSKSLEALTHSALSTVSAMASRPDVLHFHAVGPGITTPLPRYLGRNAVVQTVHGLDADRAKWGLLARRLLNGTTWMSARVPHRTITVSEALKEHYAHRFNRACVAIPNGITVKPRLPPDVITQKYGLSGGDYLLSVGRLVPEKRADLLLEAFARVPGDTKLVVVGGSSYTDDYALELERLARADPRVIMAGYVYGDELAELLSNAAAFVQPSDLEGLPLTLLEALGSELPVIVSDIPPHRDIVGSDRTGARVFTAGAVGELSDCLTKTLANLDEEAEAARDISREALRRYDWDTCAERTLAVYRDAVAVSGYRGFARESTQ